MRRIKFMVTVALMLAATMALSGIAQATAAPFANLELKITGIEMVELTPEGLRADVSFEGRAGGPHIADGTVVGVDYAVFDDSGNAHMDVYLTITDKDGDQISAHITGVAAPRNPGQYVLQGTSGTIINTQDYQTTGKYAYMVNSTFKDVGFITALSFNPPAGSIHAKWYLD